MNSTTKKTTVPTTRPAITAIELLFCSVPMIKIPVVPIVAKHDEVPAMGQKPAHYDSKSGALF